MATISISPSKLPALKRVLRGLPRATRKLRTWEREQETARAASDALYARRTDLLDRRRRLATTIAEYERDDIGKGFPSHYAECKADLKEVSEEIAALEPLRANETPSKGQSKIEQARAELVVTFDDWLDAMNTNLAKFVELCADLPATNLEKALADNRKKQTAVVGNFEQANSALLDIDTALEGMRAEVARLAERGTPRVRDLTIYRARDAFTDRKSQGQIAWPVESIFNQELTDSMRGELGISFVTWLFRDQVEAKLAAEIRAIYESKPDGIGIRDRQKAERDAKAELLALQRIEVRICDELGVAYGPRMHPLAVLEITPA